MKNKKLLLCGVVIATAIVAALNINLNLNEPASDFLLQNVEALAQGESGHSGCGGTGTVVCDGQAIYYGKYY